MRYGAFGLVEVVGSSNAVIVIDQMLKTADVSFLTWNGKCGGHETVFMTGVYLPLLQLYRQSKKIHHVRLFLLPSSPIHLKKRYVSQKKMPKNTAF